MKQKTVVVSLITVVIGGLFCLYLFKLDRLYGGALGINLNIWYFTIPALFVTNLFFVKSNEKKGIVQQNQWQKVASWCLFIAFVLICGFMMYKSVYNLTLVIAFVLSILAFIAYAIQFFFNPKLKTSGIINLEYSFIFMYVVAALTVFAYLQVLKPITIPQAQEIISETYKEKSYIFLKGLRHEDYEWLSYDFIDEFNKEKQILGVYIFKCEENDTYLSISLATEKITQ